MLPWWLRGKESATKEETQVRPLSREDPLEKEMAAHSSIPAWEIPQREEPGGLQVMRLQKSRIRFSKKTTSQDTQDGIASIRSRFSITAS